MSIPRSASRRLARVQRLGGDFGFFAAGLAGIVLATVLVSWPLWYLATRHLTVFTLLCLGLLVAVTVVLVYRKLRQRNRLES